MRKAYKYRISPTKGQQHILNTILEECRFVYNQTLAARREAWEQRQESPGLYDTQSLLPAWKVDRPSLKLVHSQVLQNVQVRVDLAFKAFFRRVKAGEQEAGYPRFKGFGRYDSITYPQYGNGVRLEGNTLILSKIGSVKVILHRPVAGQIKTVTIRRSATGKWYASLSVERSPQPLAPDNSAVGIDVGLSSFATLSNGEKIANPRFFREEECVVLVDPRNTSKRCSRCGQMVEKDLSVRVHSCPVCSLVLDRDENAAINILALGLQCLGASP
jgi:putative transposase